MKRVALVPAIASAAVLAATLVGAPAASAGRAVDDGFNRSTLPAEGTTPSGVFASAGGTYIEPADASVSAQNFYPRARSFVVVLPDERRFACPAGAIYGGVNPIVICDRPNGQDGQVNLDYPPYGNSNKRAWPPPCATFTQTMGTAVTTVPPDCLPQVAVTINGVREPITTLSMPFTMTQTKAP